MVLLIVLGALLLFSFVLTAGGAMAYLAYRLIKHLHTHERSGIDKWVQEARQHFTSMKLADNDDSEISGVFIERETNSKIKNVDGSPHYSS